MNWRGAFLGLLFAPAIMAPPLPAQANDTAQKAARKSTDVTPLSAIDWLNDLGNAPETLTETTASETPASPPAAGPDETAPDSPASIATTDLAVTPLQASSHDGIGLLPPSITGLPKTLWRGSESARLAELIATGPRDPLPAMLALSRTLMLAEAEPPASGTPDELFLARIDRLIAMGALDPALEMLRVSGHDDPEIFRRWFDVSLLTGFENDACSALVQRPDIKAEIADRVYCLARMEDWPAAELTLMSARRLGEIPQAQADLLERFLDPDLFEGAPPLPVPESITPLIFRAREAIGEGLPSTRLPLAFAEADLRPNVGWKAQIEAAERLARAGVLDGNRLIAVYRAGRPSASGGVWARSAAVQAFDTAVRKGDQAKIAAALPSAWEAMQNARTEVQFSQVFGHYIKPLAFEGDVAHIAHQIILLSGDLDDLPDLPDTEPMREKIAWAIARNDDLPGPDEAPENDPYLAAVLTAFGGAAPPAPFAQMIASDRVGEALLRAIKLFEMGRTGDPAALRDALAVLIAAGQEARARQGAIQVLILIRPT